MSAKLVLLAAALCFVAAAATGPRGHGVHSAPRDLEGYTFAHYQTEFKKVYLSQVALAEREIIFNQNIARIRSINAEFAAGRKSWFAAVNKFTDLSQTEMKRFKGYSKSLARASLSLSTEMPQLNLHDLPASVDWRAQNVVTDVKDQGGCGSCWTFSTAETLESHIAIKTGKLMVFSEQQFVSCVQNPLKCGGTGGCEGATQEIAFNYTRDAGGISLESSYPYTASDSPCDATQVKPVATIDGYVFTSNNATQLQAAIAQVGPIAISVAASGVFQLYGGGVLSGDCDFDVDHAVQAVGYGVDAASGMGFWLVRNSWGAGWGEGGYIRIFRATSGAEVCGTDTTPADGDGCAGGPASIQVCGECAVLSDSSYPYGGRLV